MRVAVIGAGAAGLASAKHIIEKGFQCDVFEMTENIGGTWAYTDEVGKDKYGFPVYTAMYQNLKTNLPKEVMGFPDFPVPNKDHSYLTQEEVLKFLNQYADHFNLKQYINFNCMVSNIHPIQENKWHLTYIYKPTKESKTKEYDAVMICNGHYNDPILPDIENIKEFTGAFLHSHAFRSPEPFKEKSVLTIGAGPSGLDVTLQISKYAKKVYFSHHSKLAAKTTFPANVTTKKDVKRIIKEKAVEFVDGSSCEVDAIVFCTGYKYSFPFLDESCGITIDNNYIQPLYKHMIHLKKPTLCFIGIPFNVCTFHMFDLQARFFCKYLSGEMSLPSTEEMQKDTEEEMKKRWAKGLTKKQAHMMGEFQENYYNDLAEAANTEPISPVLIKLRNFSVDNLYKDLINFRKSNYMIIDKENFVRTN